MASHDRTFLDNVCTTVVDLDPAHLGLDGVGGTRYSSGYTGYVDAKHDARRRWEEAFLAQHEELGDLLERRAIPKPPRPLTFRGLAAPSARAAGWVSARDLVVPGRLSVPRLDVPAGQRLLVTGPDGSGKSTLLKVLAGEVAYVGTLRVGAQRVGHLPQEATFGQPDRTPLQAYASATGAPLPLSDLGLLHPRPGSPSRRPQRGPAAPARPGDPGRPRT